MPAHSQLVPRSEGRAFPTRRRARVADVRLHSQLGLVHDRRWCACHSPPVSRAAGADQDVECESLSAARRLRTITELERGKKCVHLDTMVDCPIECVRGACPDGPGFVEKNETFLLTVIGAGSALVGVLLTYFLKSRCKTIRTPCCSCERELLVLQAEPPTLNQTNP